MSGPGWIMSSAIVLAALCAVSDLRTGTIPNRLTLVSLAAAPIAAAALAYAAGGPTEALRAAATSGAGALVCGIGPAISFARGGIGGGDVKLFAAIGALLGANVGLEAEIAALFLAAVYVPARLAWRGRLFAVLGGLFASLARRAPRPAELDERLRLAPAVLGGVLVAIALRSVR